MIEENLSIIIPTKNRREDLIESVRSIVLQSHLPQEIVIIDQSTDCEVALEKVKNITEGKINIVYLHDAGVTGAAQARNIGIQRCHGDLILFLDDDIVLLEDALANLVSLFKKDHNKEIGIIGLAIINEKSTFRALCADFIFSHGPFRAIFLHAYFHDQCTTMKKALYPCKMINGCACYRREVLSLFTFDEFFVGASYGEDMILSFRASEFFGSYFSPLVKIEHDTLRRNRKRKGIIQQYISFLNFFLYYAFTRKTICITFCYLLLVLKDVFKLVCNFYDSEVIAGITCSYVTIFKVVFNRLSLEKAVRIMLS